MREIDRRKLRALIFNYYWIRWLFVSEDKTSNRKYPEKKNRQSEQQNDTFFHDHLSKNFAYIMVKDGWSQGEKVAQDRLLVIANGQSEREGRAESLKIIAKRIRELNEVNTIT